MTNIKKAYNNTKISNVLNACTMIKEYKNIYCFMDEWAMQKYLLFIINKYNLFSNNIIMSDTVIK